MCNYTYFFVVEELYFHLYKFESRDLIMKLLPVFLRIILYKHIQNNKKDTLTLLIPGFLVETMLKGFNF